VSTIVPLFWALLHAAWVLPQRGAIRPFTWLGWTREHLLAATCVAILGALGLVAPRLRAATATVLGAFALAVYARWLSPALGVVALLAFLDAALVARARLGRFAALGAAKATALYLAAALPRSAPVDVRARGIPLDMKSRAIDFERFRVATTISSGVVPKRYFGFVDELGDTAAYETALRETIQASLDVLAPRARVPVSEMELAVTFLAEGGALLLSDPDLDRERIHPVTGIGLDDYRAVFESRRATVEAIDRRLGTQLGSLVLHVGPLRLLRRPLTFREAVAATAILYVEEKERTAALFEARDHRALASLPLDEQFVTTSLVYNSGILFSAERVRQILAFDTADSLVAVDAANHGRRPALPVWSRAEAERRLSAGAALPTQLTSWSAVYHVLQRYGAWVALQRFSDAFTSEGRFRASTDGRVP